MKKNIYKTLTLVLLIVIIFSIYTLSAFAEEHVHKRSGGWYEFAGASFRSDTEHYEYYWHYITCSCGQVLRSEYLTGIEEHSLTRTDWHMGSRHYINYECQICNYNSEPISYTCPGNPCFTYVDKIKGIILED
jgi:hypothetical protein